MEELKYLEILIHDRKHVSMKLGNLSVLVAADIFPALENGFFDVSFFRFDSINDCSSDFGFSLVQLCRDIAL